MSPDQSAPRHNFADRNKIPSPPRDPRRAAGPDDYGTKDSRQGKKKLRKRLEDLDSPRVLQAEYDKRQRREELLCAINKEAKGEPLSAVLCVARAKSSKKAAPLEEKRVDIQQNDSVDQARLQRTVRYDQDLCTMAAASIKPTFALEITGSEAENAMRKNVFAAAVGIQDTTMSNLAQPLVRIALRLLQLLRTHRAAHAGPGPYDPPDDAAQDQWMGNDQDLVDAVAELEAELTTHYAKDKINGGAAGNAAKRTNKRRMLLQKVNSIMRNGLLRAIRGKTLLSHLENKEYVTAEIENLDTIAPAQATRLGYAYCTRVNSSPSYLR